MATTFNPASFSSDQATALRQFRSQFGRNPSASEVSSWQASRGGGAPGPAAPAAAPAGQPGSANVQRGFGGRPMWDVVSEVGLGPADFESVDGLQRTPLADVGRPGSEVAPRLASLEESIDKLSAANASMLKGEIPADVSASVRRAASESAISGGIFGEAARGLSARDLGKTSLDIKQQGIANEGAIAEAKSGLAQSYESIRQFNLTRNTALAQLSIQSRQANLQAVEQERARIATNIEANVNILNQIAQMAIQQQSIAASAASNDVDPTNIIASLDNMIAQFTRQLS